jgi:uncharacterized membrane protein YeaQ/YmgE (transglycosylase-associated protein family)
MYLLAWVFIGVLAGWVAGRDLRDCGYGPFLDVAAGIGGAVGGGLLLHASGYSGIIVTALFAAICAVLLTILAGFANGGRAYALQS